MKNIGVLHVITDTTLQSRFTHAALAELAIAGGADTVQFRQKYGTTRELITTAQSMQTLCAQHKVPLIVNDRADIALAVGGNGGTFRSRRHAGLYWQTDPPYKSDHRGIRANSRKNTRSYFRRRRLYRFWAHLRYHFKTGCGNA